MKKLYSLCMLLVSVLAAAYGQPCPPAGISTNPNAPLDPFLLNNIVNLSDPEQPFTINPFLNAFNWGEIAGADFKTIGIDLCTYWEFDNSIVLANPGDPCPLYYPMISFMSDDMPSQFNYLKEPQTNAFITDRDYHWEDGWELLWMNLGYLPDGTSIGGPHATGSPFQGNNYSAKPDNIPYIIIYNRYRGIMRLVANVWDNRIKHQNLQVKLLQSGGNGNLTGILRAIENYDRPLSMQTNIFENTSPRFQTVLSNQWMVADFQMAYDPCSCISQGKFDIEFWQFNSMNIEMIGREISATQEIDENNYTMNDFMNLSEINPTEYKPGSMIYRSMEDMIDQYKTKLDKYDQEMNDYNSLGNQLIRLGLDAGETLINLYMPSVGGNPKSEDSKDFKKLLAKGMDFAAMEILPKTFDKPVKPTTPTATYTETAFKGTIGSTYIDVMGPFYMPGTFPSSYGSGQPGLTPFNYPAYNEVLGQFALLEKPKVQMEQEFSESWYQCVHSGDMNCLYTSDIFLPDIPPSNIMAFESITTNHTAIKLAEPLIFSFNPALDFDHESTTVDVAFIFTYSGMGTKYDMLEIISREIQSPNMFLAHWFRPCADPYSLCENKLIVESDWRSAGDAFGSVYKSNLITTSIGSTSNPTFAAAYSSNNMDLKLEKIEMKLLVDMFFDQTNSRNQQNNVTQAFTYLVWKHDPTVSSFEESGVVTVASVLSAPEAIHFNAITLGDWVAYINGNDGPYSSVIADKVKINTLTASHGNQHYGIDARTQIRLLPGAHLRPNGRLRIIDDPLAEFGEPASTGYVEDFCLLSTPEPYQGNFATRPLMQRISDRVHELEMREQIASAKATSSTLTLYPNPARSEITLQSKGTGIDRIGIFDASGRSLIQESSGGQLIYQMDISNLAPGVYVVRATCGDELFTDKLVVTR